MENRSLANMNSAGWTALNHDDLARNYPAVVATRPADKVSGRYTFIPTVQVIEQFEKTGWLPVHVKMAHTRDEGREGFQKHLVRFRQAGAVPNAKGLFPEIILANSHDAGSAFILKAGIFRLVCTNGMVVGDTWFSTPRVLHTGYRDQLIIEAIDQVSQALPRALAQVETWETLEMTPDDRGVYGLNALIKKYGPFEVGRREFDLERLLAPARQADRGQDLYKTFNIAQEKLVERGGRFERRINPDTWQNRRAARNGLPLQADLVKTRAVNAPDQNVALNAAIWGLTGATAEGLAQGVHKPEGRSQVIQGALKDAARQVQAELDGEGAGLPFGVTKDQRTAALAAEIMAGRL